MFKAYKLTAFYVLLILIPFLQSCGGGGGGGDSGPNFTVSTSEIFFGAPAPVGGATPANQTISGTVTNYSGVLYVFIVVPTTHGVSTVTGPMVQGDTAVVTVVPKLATTLVKGVYFDTIEVSACSDFDCNNHLPGSPRTISVSYVVGTVAVPSTLSFSAVAGGAAPPPKMLTIYHYQRNTAWTSSLSFTGDSGWVSYNPISGQTPTTTTVNVAMPPATAANLQAQIDFNVNGALVPVPITYTVAQ